MNDLNQILTERQEALVAGINDLSKNKLNNLEALAQCYEFVKEASRKAETDFKKVLNNPNFQETIRDNPIDLILSGDWNTILSQGRINIAANLIPEEFYQINTSSQELMNSLSLDETALRFLSYTYHQFFISIVATLDDFVSQLLILVLKAYPGKLGSQEFPTKKKLLFSDLNHINNERDLFQLVGFDKADKLIDDKVYKVVRGIMQADALQHIKELRKYLETDENFLRLEWLLYAEMRLRRHAGVHSGWFGKQEYNQKIIDLQRMDTGNQLNLSKIDSDFLGFDAQYFCRSYSLARFIIEQIKTYCEQYFAQDISGEEIEDAH